MTSSRLSRIGIVENRRASYPISGRVCVTFDFHIKSYDTTDELEKRPSRLFNARFTIAGNFHLKTIRKEHKLEV